METKTKFSVTDAATLQRLADATDLAGIVLARGEVAKVHDTYFDTVGRSILAAGWACRRREQGGETLVALRQLKRGQDAAHPREDIQAPVSVDASPAEWPAPLRDRVRALIGTQELVALFDLRQTRTARKVRRGEMAIAELCLDDLQVNDGDRELSFSLAKVELLPDGTESDREAIAKCLQEEWQLQPEPRNKFQIALEFVDAKNAAVLLTPEERAECMRMATEKTRASRRAKMLLALDAGASPAEASERSGLSPARVQYWLAAFQSGRRDIFSARSKSAGPDQRRRKAKPAQTKPGLAIDDTMAEAARKTLWFHFQQMLKHEAGTRAGVDVEELHDMRVATRRMRAALRVCGDYLDSKTVKGMSKGLRRTAQALGAVRDLDVFNVKTQCYVDTLPLEKKGGLEMLNAAWRKEHAARRQELISYLDSEGFAGFKEESRRLLKKRGSLTVASKAPDQAPQPTRVRHVLPSILYAGLSEVLAYDEALSDASVPLVRYHQLRIASKRLRYTLEFFEEVLGPETHVLIAPMKDLQDHLGNLQDGVVACRVLSEVLAQGRWPGEGRETAKTPPVFVAPGVAAYLAARQEEIQQLVNSFPEVWSKIASPEFKQGLAARVAVL